jgi:hypothetical protein
LLASRDEVRTLDPVVLHVEGALAEVDDGQAPLASAQVGDARRLLYTDASAMPYCCGRCSTSPTTKPLGCSARGAGRADGPGLGVGHVLGSTFCRRT